MSDPADAVPRATDPNNFGLVAPVPIDEHLELVKTRNENPA